MKTFLSVLIVGCIASGFLIIEKFLVQAAPAGYRLPFYDRASITNGPGEGLHGATTFSPEAIDYDTLGSLQATATNSGVVCYSSTDNTGFGNIILIHHGESRVSYYAHLAHRHLNLHDPVNRGELVGTIGNTGCGKCGVHLHFEIRNNVTIRNDGTCSVHSGNSLNIRDLIGNGWFPWWPISARSSGFVVYSTSHQIDNCSSDNTIDIQWPSYTNITGGNNISGYSYEWSMSSATIPDSVRDLESDSFSHTSPPLSSGSTWYFHIRAQDNSGNWGNDSHVAHYGPLCISEQAPPVEMLVYGAQGWQDTSISVQPGDTPTVEYVSGLWSPWPGGFYDGRGVIEGEPCQVGHACIVFGVSHASLIGQVGNSNPFHIGNGPTIFSVQQAGNIFLRINDTQLGDNSGSITVRITR